MYCTLSATLNPLSTEQSITRARFPSGLSWHSQFRDAKCRSGLPQSLSLLPKMLPFPRGSQLILNVCVMQTPLHLDPQQVINCSYTGYIPVIRNRLGSLPVFLNLHAIKVELLAIKLKDSLSHTWIFLRKSSAVKSGASRGLFVLLYVESSSSQDCCVSLALHWKSFARETTFADFSTAASSTVTIKELSEDQKSCPGTCHNNLLFRWLWTFHGSYKTPSFFCRGLPGYSLRNRGKPQKWVMLCLDADYGFTPSDEEK